MSTGEGLRALLLDDDEYALDFLHAILQERYPELEVEKRVKPDPSGVFDIYFLDDDFDGLRVGGQLARGIRAQRPEAVILAFSASLDRPTLKELLNAGCNGVCDKKVPSDMPLMLAALGRCIDELDEESRRPPDNLSGRYIVKTFRELFHEWNLRLERKA